RTGLHVRTQPRRGRRRASRRVRLDRQESDDMSSAARSRRQLTLPEIAPLIHSGMTIGIGGWGSRRKPLALVREVIRSGAQDLRIVSFGGPDVGLLCATGQASEVVHAFVSLDSVAIDPHFAAARQNGTV